MTAKQQYRFELVEDRAQLEAENDPVAVAWRELWTRSAWLNPFLSWEWTRACLGSISRSADPFVLLAWEGGTLRGVAPLRKERRWGFRSLRFIGDGRSDYLGFLTDGARPDTEAALLADLTLRAARWDVSILRQLCPATGRLAEQPHPAALRTHSTRGTVAPYLDWSGVWEDLRSNGPSVIRKSLKDLARFEREGGSVERHTGPALDAAACDQLVRTVQQVEQRSWKGRQGVARFSGAGGELLRQALTALGPQERMEVWIARIQGEAAAFQVNFLTPQRLWYYQGAYAEEHRRLSPGRVLVVSSLRAAWEAGRREYDFMSGDEGYKAGWTNAEHELRYRALHPATPRGHLAYWLEAGLRWRLKDHPSVRGLWERGWDLRRSVAALWNAAPQRRARVL